MAEICKQMNIEVADKVGKLAEVADKIKDAGVNILAICAWTEGQLGKMMVVTEDNDKASAAIGSVVEKCQSSEIVCLKVPNERGALDTVAHKLADAGILIRFIYSSPGDAKQATLVLDTDDNARAAELL